jgi:N utilization substance protein A
MKSDFLIAITQLSAEKNLPKETVIGAVEAALVSAYKKDEFVANQNIRVKINPNTGGVKVWAEKVVVEVPLDNRCEISLAEARRSKLDIQIGEITEVEATPHNAGRIAAQTAKQVILQRLHEAEHSAIFEEYAGKEGDTVTGLVQRIESRQIFIDLGRTEAILPALEQVPNERYRMGQRLKVYLLEVARTNRGPRVIVSRSHPDLLRRLFELEVPEVYNGIVEIKSIAREAGFRSKIAVATSQDGIDPVGCCVGLRGIRIQNIVNELNGEKIDVVMWHPEQSILIANALSPAKVLGVELNNSEQIATVVIPDRQLSLAIGKEGQNVRLAAKLTGWHIDIKSASVAEAQRAAEAKLVTEVEKETVTGGEIPSDEPDTMEPFLLPGEEEFAEPTTALEAEPVPIAVPFKPETIEEKPQLRFAEDISVSKPIKTDTKQKKKKKSAQDKTAEDGIKLKKRRRAQDVQVDEEEY